MIEDSNVTRVDHGLHCKVDQDCTRHMPTLFTIISAAHWLIKTKIQISTILALEIVREEGGPYTTTANSKDTLTFPNHIISITKCCNFMNTVCINFIVTLLVF